MEQPQACREKDREFKELFYRFQEQGKRLADVYNRLTAISVRIEEEPVEPTLQDKPPSHLNTGLFSDFFKTVDGYGELISQIESRVSKIERFI